MILDQSTAALRSLPSLAAAYVGYERRLIPHEQGIAEGVG